MASPGSIGTETFDACTPLMVAFPVLLRYLLEQLLTRYEFKTFAGGVHLRLRLAL